MILAHHGFGEEIILYAAASGGAGSALVLAWRLQLRRAARWLRRR